MLRVLAIAALLLAPAAAQAAPKGGKAQDCFYARNLQSWAPQDNRTVNLRVGIHDYFQLKLVIECTEIDWHETIVLQSRGGNWICTGQDVTVIVPSTPLGPQRCMASDLRRLSPEEVAALPGKARP
jgi:hypothetical protein